MEKPEQPIVIRVRQSGIDDGDFPLGIARLSADERVMYMNRALRDMVGAEIEVGTSVSSISLDPGSKENLRIALTERFEDEEGSSYRLMIDRKDAGTRVRLHVSAVPEYDAEGKLIGSIGFLVDESVDEATTSIYQAMQQAPDSTSLFKALCERLHEVVRFDTLLVTGISQNRQHLQRLFEDPPPPDDVLPTKWWPMPPFVKAMFEEFKPGPLDLEELFEQPEFVEYARVDPGVKQFRERGFRYALRLGVYRARQLIAMVSLMRRQPVAFTETEFGRCMRLPIVEAVNAAMTLDRHRHLQFGLDLINGIAEVAESIADVAQRLVDRLEQHYDWQHVSLFRVDEDRRRLRLICQAGEPSYRLRDDYDQGFSEGLLGKAYGSKTAVNEGDVLAPSFAGAYVCGIASTRSEMVLPVPGSKLRWLLNVESSLRDAFADEEQSSVELLLRVAGFILDRTATLELKTAILKAVADAVIQTNSLGVIQDANPAAERLLQRPLADLQQRNLSSFITSSADERPAEEEGSDAPGAWEVTETAVTERNTGVMLVQAGDWPSTPVDLVRADGRLVPVLMSAATLPSELGGKVFVASDLTNQKRVEHMELLKRGLRNVASEIRVPLALAATFLGDATKKSADVHELVSKSLKQIRKADLPLERVIRLATASDDKPLPHAVFDLRAAVNEMRDDLPRSEARSVHVVSRDSVVLARAARHELVFCIESLLAYLLSRKSQVEQVAIRVGQHASKAFVTLSLFCDGSNGAQSRSGTVDDLGDELSLAEPAIEELMRRMGGFYDVRARDASRFRLVVASGEQSCPVN